MLKRLEHEIPVISNGFYNWQKSNCLTSKNMSDTVFYDREKVISLSSPALVHLRKIMSYLVT